MHSSFFDTHDAQDAFLHFLSEHGHPMGHRSIQGDGKFHAIPCPHGNATDARYFFHPGNPIPGGYLHCWHCGIKANFSFKKQHETDDTTWRRHQEEMRKSIHINEMEAKKAQARVKKLAQALFASAQHNTTAEHAYLKLKQIKNHGFLVWQQETPESKEAKVHPGTLMIRCFNAHMEVVNIERIFYSEKRQKFQKMPLKGGERKGTFGLIGQVSHPQGTIYLAEGCSTAATIHEATGEPCFFAFSGGNLASVLQTLSTQYPSAHLVIAADRDNNHAGERYAQQAIGSLASSHVRYVLPDFAGISLEAEPSIARSDFNDLFCLLTKTGWDPDGAFKVIKDQLKPQHLPHHLVLSKLTEQLHPVDFRKLAQLDERKKLGNNHYQIITIEHIRQLARAHHWGLCRRDEATYVFNGAFWQIIHESEVKAFLSRSAEKMGVDPYTAKHCPFIEQLYNQFCILETWPKPTTSSGKVLINLHNGTFSISPQEKILKRFDSADFMTYQLPFAYDPITTCPLFQGYLNQVLPDRNVQHILAEYLGYIFIDNRALKLEKVLLLYGSGANGKSVFYEIIKSLLGDTNTCSYSLQDLTNESGYQRAELNNKLVNYGSEINGKLNSAIFKQLASGEAVAARSPYGRPFIMTRYAKLIFNCNELPKEVEHTNAYYRRCLIVPFEVNIPEDQQDKQLAQKIISQELSGVFNWVLAGLDRLMEQKNFTDSHVIRHMREEYEKDSDNVRYFLSESGYEASSLTTDFMTLKNLYQEYRTFCMDNGFCPVNKANFSRRLEGLSIPRGRRKEGHIFYLKKECPHSSLTLVGDNLHLNFIEEVESISSS